MRLEQRVGALGHPLGRNGQQRADVGVELVLGAVVGVQRDGDRVFRGDDMSELGERHGAGDHVLDTQPGAEFAPPVENWMMPSLPASAKP